MQEVRRVPFLEVRDRLGRELIRVVELLSPTNKRGARIASNIWPGARHCSKAPLTSWRSTCSVAVGRCPWSGDPGVIIPFWSAAPTLGPGPAFGRSGCANACPLFPIPLLPGDPEARIDLQEILHHVYDATGYEDFIYASQPDPLLSSRDAAWARAFVAT